MSLLLVPRCPRTSGTGRLDDPYRVSHSVAPGVNRGKEFANVLNLRPVQNCNNEVLAAFATMVVRYLTDGGVHLLNFGSGTESGNPIVCCSFEILNFIAAVSLEDFLLDASSTSRFERCSCALQDGELACYRQLPLPLLPQREKSV